MTLNNSIELILYRKKARNCNEKLRISVMIKQKCSQIPL